MERTAHAMAITVERPLPDVEADLRAALADEGFGVLTEIDVQETLHKKLGVDRAPYKILGACNPELASRALLVQEDIGVILPCNVALYAHDGATVVAAFEPMSMVAMVDNPALEPIAEDARARLDRVLQRVGR